MQARIIPFLNHLNKQKKYYLGSFLVISSLSFFEMINNQRLLRGMQYHSLKSQTNATSNQVLEQNIQNYLNPPKQKLRQKIFVQIQLLLRLTILFINFLPYLLFLPFSKLFPFEFIINIKYDLMVKSIERSGSLLVKISQYLSHRRDLIDARLIKKINHLREKAPMHSFQDTIQILINNDIYDQIEEIQEDAIASGIIGQVYKAKLKNYNKQIIIKVRHPGVMRKLQEDMKLLFQLTEFISKLPFCSQAKIPMTKNELLKVIIEQADFRIEGNNLKQFKQNFDGLQDLIKFPDIYYSSEDLLIEEYIENAKGINEFSKAPPALKKRLANLGLQSFFKMFIYDNFIHADCHAGNLIVQKKKQKKKKISTLRSYYIQLENKIYYYFNYIYLNLQKGFIYANLKNNQAPQFKQFQINYLNHKIAEAQELFSEYDIIYEYQLYMIDFGMVSTLKQKDYKYMIKFLKAILLKDSEQCCKYTMKMATNFDLENEQQMELLKDFQNELRETYSQIDKFEEVSPNLGEIAQCTIQNAQKRGLLFDGNVSVFLGNTVILEGLARTLDKDINMMNNAIPYLTSKKIKKLFKE